MTLELLTEFFKWCSIINIGLMLWWFLFIALAHDFVYHWHSKWFPLTVERFDGIHYAGITFFKILVFVLNIVPYVVLLIIG